MVKKKRIVVIPLAGLGNRMRVLSSCIQIAKREDRALWIVWPVNSDLGCDITDIFESIGMEYSVPPKWLRFILINVYRTGAIRRFYTFYKFFSGLFFSNSIFDRDIIDETQSNQLNTVKWNSDGSTILVATCLAFGEQHSQLEVADYLKNEDSRELFKSFRFTDYLRNEVDREYNKIGESYIGIHIRRTDHIDIIKNNPYQSYLTVIDRFVKENPAQKFFLATDSEETKQYFLNEYRNMFHTVNYKLGRADLEGIYGGIIELLLLAHSTKIICSIISSYSNTAILIGNVEEVAYVDKFLNR
jgi:hypothetical protein